MKFDRSFAGDQLAGDLFVEQAQYQQSKDLSLARGEQVIAVAQLGDLSPLLERVRSRSLAARMASSRWRVRNGFVKNSIAPPLHCPHRHRDVAMRCHEYYWELDSRIS